MKCFPSTLRWRDLKRKTPSGRPHDYCVDIVFEKLRFQSISFYTKTKSRRFKIPPVSIRAFSIGKLRFHDRLVWTVGLTVSRNKPAFSNFSSKVWMSPINFFQVKQERIYGNWTFLLYASWCSQPSHAWLICVHFSFFEFLTDFS